MSFLVDTNVFSETLKRNPDQRVVAWLRENESEIFVSVITIAEIRRGIERLPQGKRREELTCWLSGLSTKMKRSILSYNRSVAHVWGQMRGKLDTEGIHLASMDSILAATAIRHNLTVVTRNTKDFEHAPVTVLNPFK